MNIVLFVSLFCASLIVTYVAFTWFLYVHWLSVNTVDPKKGSETLFISVVIAAKNEEHNLPALFQCLRNQSYPKSLYEVILIDDHSADHTFTLAGKYQDNTGFNSKTVKTTGQGKKAALTTGIAGAKGEIIACTDADCLPGPDWLVSIASLYQTSHARLVFGPVAFYDATPKGLLEKMFFQMQAIEFASLVGAGAASWQAGFPNMCNGANFSFRKAVFYEVGGYEDNAHINSGDDEFLMHKVYAAYPHDVYFLKSKGALVETRPNGTPGALYRQRMRWASKWENYTGWKVKVVALFVFLVNLSQVVLIAYAVKDHAVARYITLLVLFRWVSEFVFLHSTLSFMNKKINLAAYGSLVIIYPFYVVFFALAARIVKLGGTKRSAGLK